MTMGRKTTLAGLLCTLPIIIWSLDALAQSSQALRYYDNAYKTVANNYKNKVRQFLNEEQKEKLDAIRFKFNPSQNLIAQAFKNDNEQRFVEISFGFMAFMENLTFAYAVSGEANNPRCYYFYLNTAAKAVLNNAKRRRNGQPPNLIPFFAYYVRQNGRGCRSITKRDLYSSEARKFVPGGMDSVMAILLGHEVAHHLLGHVDLKRRISLKESREKEADADFWAVEHAFAIGINPSPAFPIWSFFAAIGGADIQSELESTHPLGMRRWAHSLDQIIQHMRGSDYARKFGKAAPEFAIREMLQMRNAINRLIPN